MGKFSASNIRTWFRLKVLSNKLTLYKQTFICLLSAQSAEGRVNMKNFDAGKMLGAVTSSI